MVFGFNRFNELKINIPNQPAPVQLKEVEWTAPPQEIVKPVERTMAEVNLNRDLLFGVKDAAEIQVSTEKWITLNSGLTIRIDTNRNTLHIFKPSLHVESYVDSKVDGHGRQTTTFHHLILASYKVNNRKRFHEKDLIAKLNGINAGHKEVEDVLIRYLGLKPIKAPSPQKAPLLYSHQPAHETDLFKAICAIDGKMSSEEILKIHHRIQYFREMQQNGATQLLSKLGDKAIEKGWLTPEEIAHLANLFRKSEERVAIGRDPELKEVNLEDVAKNLEDVELPEDVEDKEGKFEQEVDGLVDDEAPPLDVEGFVPRIKQKIDENKVAKLLHSPATFLEGLNLLQSFEGETHLLLHIPLPQDPIWIEILKLDKAQREQISLSLAELYAKLVTLKIIDHDSMRISERAVSGMILCHGVRRLQDPLFDASKLVKSIQRMKDQLVVAHPQMQKVLAALGDNKPEDVQQEIPKENRGDLTRDVETIVAEEMKRNPVLKDSSLKLWNMGKKKLAMEQRIDALTKKAEKETAPFIELLDGIDQLYGQMRLLEKEITDSLQAELDRRQKQSLSDFFYGVSMNRLEKTVPPEYLQEHPRFPEYIELAKKRSQFIDKAQNEAGQLSPLRKGYLVWAGEKDLVSEFKFHILKQILNSLDLRNAINPDFAQAKKQFNLKQRMPLRFHLSVKDVKHSTNTWNKRFQAVDKMIGGEPVAEPMQRFDENPTEELLTKFILRVCPLSQQKAKFPLPLARIYQQWLNTDTDDYLPKRNVHRISNQTWEFKLLEKEDFETDPIVSLKPDGFGLEEVNYRPLQNVLTEQQKFEEILLHEVDIDPRKQAERAFQYILENPLRLKELREMDALSRRIFDVNQIDGLLHLELAGRSQYLSKTIPLALAQSQIKLGQMLVDPTRTVEEKAAALMAQGHLMMLGMRIQNYLESYNALHPEMAVDAAGYKDLKEKFIALCLNPRLSLHERKKLAQEFLNEDYMEGQEPTEMHWDLAVVADLALWKSLEDPQVALFYLNKQLPLLWKENPKPEISISRAHISELVFVLKINGQFEYIYPFNKGLRDARWYLKGAVSDLRKKVAMGQEQAVQIPEQLEKDVKNVLKHDLKLLPTEKEGERVRIKGTHFTYSAAEGLLYWKGCAFESKMPEALAFAEGWGECFHDRQANGYWIVKDDKPLYYFSKDNACIKRIRDGAVAHTKILDQGLIWHSVINGQWKAISIQTLKGMSEREMRIEGNHLVSQLHPGYFVSKHGLKVNQMDFSLLPEYEGQWLHNDHGDHLLEANLFGQEVELHYSQGRFTGKPWEQLAIAIHLGDVAAMQMLTHDLQLTPPSSAFQKKVAQSLGEMVSNGPFNPIGVWMQLAMLELGIRGDQSEFMSLPVQKMQAILMSYQEYQTLSMMRTSDETERQFLIACRRWFVRHEGEVKSEGLLQNIISLVKRQDVDPGHVKEAKAVRLLYRVLARPVTERRAMQLIENREGKKQLQKMPVMEEIDFDQIDKVMSSRIGSHEELTDAGFLDNYRIAKEGSKEEKAQLLDQLELKPKLQQKDLWLVNVAARPHLYPPFSKVDAIVKKIEEIKGQEGKEQDELIELVKPQFLELKKLFAPPFSLKVRMVASVAVEVFRVLMKIFSQKKWFKPLQLSKTPFAKAFFKTKKKFQNDKEALKLPLKQVDDLFDAYFLSMKQLVLSVKPKADDRPQYQLEGKDQKVKEYRDLTPPIDIALKEGKIEEATQSIEDQLRDLQETLKVREQALLLQANTSKDDASYVHRKALGRDLSWEDLISLVYKQQVHAYDKHLADAASMSTVESGVYSYLAIRARLHQMQRVKKALNAVADHPNDSESLRALNEQLSATRGYSGTNPIDRLLLFYEAASPKGLFKHEQVLKINEIGAKKVALAEMPTGYGKTDYIIPMINEWVKEADHVPVLKKGKVQHVERAASKLKRLILDIWPSQLVSVNSQAIRQKSSQAKGGRAFEMHFTREMGFDALQLEKLLLDLEIASEKGIPVSSRAEDIAALHLHFTETLERIYQGKTEKEDRERLKLFREILRIYHGTTVGRIDEEQEVLDPMKRTIYTVGKSVACPAVAIDFATDFFALLSQKRGDQESPFVRAMSIQRNLTTEEVENYLKEIFDDPTINAIANFVGMNPEPFRKFLKGELDQPEGAPNPQTAFLAKGYFYGIVKATLSGAVDVQYGLSKAHFDRFKFAIPYEKKDIPRETKEMASPSVYSNVDETLFKTLRIYHARGLTKEDLVDLFSSLVLEFRETESASILETIKRFREQFGIDDDTYLKIQEVLPDDPKNLIRAALPKDLEVNKESQWIAQFIKYVVAPGLTIYPTSVGFSPQDLALVLGESISLSATPRKPEAHSLRTEFVEMKGAEGKLYDLLMTKIREIQQMPQDDEFLDALNRACREQNVCAVADPSGMMRFEGDFVRKIADHFGKDHPIKHIVYFDTAQEKFVRYSIENETTQPFEAETHAECLDETLTLYDMARSTGSDILQRPTGVEILLTSPSTNVIQAGQGAGRMRKLDKGQSLIVWNQGNENTNQALVNLWKKNEEEGSRAKNFTAVQQLMSAEVRIAMMRKLIGLPVTDGKPLNKRIKEEENISLEQILKLYEEYRSELVTDENYDPQARYGSLGKMLTGDEALVLSQKHQTAVAKKKLSRKEAKSVCESLEKYGDAWKNLLLPQAVPGMRLGESQEMQQEQELQQEQEQELQVDRHLPAFQWKKPKAWPTLKELQDKKFVQDQKVVRSFRKFKELNKQIKDLENDPKKSPKVQRKIVSLQKKRMQIALDQEKRMRKIKGLGFHQLNAFLEIGLMNNLEGAARLFSDNLLVSENLIGSINAVENALIDVEKRMPIHRILLISEVVDKAPRMMAIAINSEDDIDLVQLMNEAQEQPALKRQLAVYDLATDGIVDRSKGFDFGMADSDQAQELIAQAKLLGGYTSYTRQQKDLLIRRAEEIDPKKGVSLIARFLKSVTPISLRKPLVEYVRLFKR